MSDPSANPEPRTPRLIQVAGGTLLAALGLFVMIAWAIHFEAATRLGPDFPPMRFNTALGFLLFGIALLTLARGRASLSRTTAGLLALLGLATLIEYGTGLDLRIDELFIRDYLITALEPYPGRMAPATGLCFVLSGVSLLLNRRGRTWTIAAALTASLVAAQGAAVLSIYALALEAIYKHQSYAGMALHTAALFFIGGVTLLVSYGIEDRDTAPRWIPSVVGLGALSLTLVLWHGLQVQERSTTQRLLDAEVTSVTEEISNVLQLNMESLERMAHRWEYNPGNQDHSAWESDARAYLSDLEGAHYVDRVDAAGHIVWSMPDDHTAAGRDYAKIMDRLRKQDGVAATMVRVPGRHGTLVMLAPTHAGGSVDGALAIVFGSAQLLKAPLERREQRGYALLVQAWGRPIYESAARAAGDTAFGEYFIEFHGLRWDVRIYNTPALSALRHSPLNTATLVIGSLLSLLAAIALQLLLTARRQERDIKEGNRRLSESEAKYFSMLSAMQDGVFVAQDYRFVFANQALAAMLGYESVDDVLGKPFEKVVAPKHLRIWTERFEARIAGGEEPLRRYDVMLEKRDGETIWVELHAQRAEFEGERAVLGVIHDISDRKLSERLVRDYQERIELVARSAVDSIWDWNIRSGDEYLSPNFFEQLGYEEGDLPRNFNHWAPKLLHPDDRVDVMDRLQRHLDAHEAFAAECRLRGKDGVYRWYRLSGQATWDAGGRPERMAGSLVDITQRKEIEIALMASEARFRSAMENAAIGMALVGLDGRWLKVNSSVCRMLGYTEDELMSRTFQDLTYADDLEADLQHVQRLVAGETTSYQMEKRYIRKDGAIIWARLAVSLSRDVNGEPEYFVAQIEDIDLWKHAEQDLRESEERFRAVAETANDALISADSRGIIIYINEAAAHTFGYADQELLGQNVDIIIPERYRAAHDEKMHAASGGDTGGNLIGKSRELAGLRKDGSEFPLDISLAAWNLHGERFFTAIIRDISERRRAEELVRSTLALQSAILDSSSLSVIATDRQGLITLFNRAASRLLGYEAEEMIGKQTPECFHDRTEVEKYAHELSEDLGEPVSPGFETFVARTRVEAVDNREWTYVSKDGKRIPVLLSVTAIRDSTGQIQGYLGIGSDLRERQDQARRLEVALSEKETLLKEVYHRVKNNLQVIRSLLNLHSRTLPEGPARIAMQETAERVRAMALVHEKLYQSGNLAEISLKEYVSDLLGQLWESTDAAANGIRLNLEVEPMNVGLDTAIPLGLLINELVSNALKHAFPGGRQGSVDITLQSDSNGGARLTIRDDGKGLPADLDPARSRTMGLKLATSLATQLGGSLEIGSDAGAAFELHIARLQ